MSSNSNGQPPPEDYSSTASAAINSERILRSGILKSHSPFDSSFDSDNDAESNLADQQRRLNSNSPPPKCAICLCRCHNKCFTDSCLHQFCFTCLLEWSKIKAECPLCKTNFKSIIHDVKSIDNFKEYQVRPASNPSFSDLHMRAGRRQSFFEMEYDARQPMNVNIINLSRRPPPYSRRNDSIQDFFMIRTDQSRPYPHPAHLGHPHHPAIVAPPLRRMAVEEESNEPIVLVADHQPVSEVVVSNSPPILIDHNREDISVSAANSNVLATTTMSNAVMNLSSLPLLRRRQSMHEAPPAHSSSSSVFHRLDFLLAEPPRFTYSATLQVRPQQTEAIRQLLLTNQSSLTERYLRLFPNDSIPIRQHVQEWRKYVYDRSLYALPLPDVTGRFRECSAAFYRENPAQMHRLIPWLNRELVALLSTSNTHRIPTVLEEMSEFLPLHDIESGACRRYFQVILRQRTMHFLHEFLNYARSPYDLIGYDRSVEYTPRFLVQIEPQVVDVSSSSDNEDVRLILDDLDDLMGGQAILPPSMPHAQNRSGGVIVTSTVVTNNDSTGDQVAGPSGTSLEQQNSDAMFTRNGTTVQITRNISVSSNSDSEVEFVLERKPPHLRTPEQVNLSELDSDSDVIFVENEKKLPTVIESSSDSSDDNKPLSFTVKRFKAELPGPPSSEFRVEYRLNEENQMPDEVVAGPSGLCGESNASSKYEHKKFYRRKCGELYSEMNFRNFHTSNNSTSSSTSTDSTSDMEWTKEESLRKAAGAKSSPSKRTKNKLKAPGNLKRKRKVKKAKKNTAKKELKTLLPLAELSSTEPKSPDSSPNSLDLSTSETPHSLDKKDQIRNYYNDTKIMLRDMDANVLWQCTSKPVEQRDGSDEEQPSGSHEAGTSEQVDKPKLKSVIIRKNPNYYIKKAPDTSSDDSG